MCLSRYCFTSYVHARPISSPSSTLVNNQRPFLTSRPFQSDQSNTAAFSHLHHLLFPAIDQPARHTQIRPAMPPTYLLTLPLLPIRVAVYICTTRCFQSSHLSFGVISGTLMGPGRTLRTWLALRWYRLEMREGGGHWYQHRY